MRKVFTALFIIFLLFAFSSQAGNVSADEKGDEGVKKFEGEPKLSKKEIDSILTEKGYSAEEIEETSLSTKKDMITTDGEKASYTTDVVHTYTSLDGVTYEVTEENKSEIEEIKQQDLESMNMDSSDAMNSTMAYGFDGGESDGDWSVTTFVQKIDETSSEYEYAYFTDWTWDSYPIAQYTDNIAIAWESDFTALANTDQAYAWAIANYADGDRMIGTTDQVLDLQDEIYGLKTKIGLGNWKRQAGGMSQQLRIPKSLSGTTSSIVGKYVHPYSAFDVSLNIGAGTISSDSFWGDEWTWRVNITVGE